MTENLENHDSDDTPAAELSSEAQQVELIQKSAITSPAPAKPEIPQASPQTWLLHFLSSISVRYKIAGTLIIILGLAVATLGIVTVIQQKASLLYELKSRAEILVQQLANVGKEGLLTKQEMPVFSAIMDIQRQEDVVYAMVMDYKGKVFAHNNFKKKGAVLTGPSDRAAMQADALLFQDTGSGNAPVLEAAIPIMLKAKNLKIGVARIGLSEKALKASLTKQKITFYWVALAFVFVGLLGSFALARVLTKPLDSLAEGIQVVARGDLRKLVAVRSTDEIGKLTNVFNQMILSLREKLLMEKYLSQSTVLSIKEHRDVTQLKLGGERKYVTALFSDARGFTSLSEQMSPEDVVSLMNIYLNLQTTVIHHWGGIVDKFVGDEVMAIFEGKGMEGNAVRAAVEIQSYCKALNEARVASGEKQVSIGIGLNSGEVVMGNMGSEDHMDYTVIGDNINIAARLCGVAKPGQVLVSRLIAEEVGDQATWKELPAVLVKGKDKPISIAEAVAIKGGARRYMRKATDVSITYSLEGFSDESNTGVVNNIGPAGCLLEVGGPIGIGSKLRVNFNMIALGKITVRTTVYHARKQERAYYIGLYFDDLPIAAKHDIVTWIHRVNSEIVEGLFL
jgi:class 3 adenylate cyclase